MHKRTHTKILWLKLHDSFTVINDQMHMTKSKLSYVWISFPVQVHKIATESLLTMHMHALFSTEVADCRSTK